MYRGEGPTTNKFWKHIGTRAIIVEVGNAPHQYTVEALKNGKAPTEFTRDEVDEMIAAFDPAFKPEPRPDGSMTRQQVADLLASEKAKWLAEEEAKKHEVEIEEKLDAAVGVPPKAEGLKEWMEVGNVPAPNAKRGPGRPRKAD